MAAAEPRTVWQRMANRCFVPEDAKRAPNLASCSSQSSKVLPDSRSETVTNHAASNFLPFSWNQADSNLPPETKWWLQLQPNLSCQNDVTSEEQDASEEIESGKEGILRKSSSASGDSTSIEGASVFTEKKSNSCEAHRKMPTNFVKQETKASGEMKAGNDDFGHLNKLNAAAGEFWYQTEEFKIDWNSPVHSALNKPDKESPSLWSEKTEPWWRIADENELASFVARKSLQNLENCDLPPPRKVHFCPDSVGWLEGLDDQMFSASSLDQRLLAGATANSCSASVNKDGGCQPSELANSFLSSSKTYSLTTPCSGMYARHSTGNAGKDPPESKHRHSGSDQDKSELLEALHHSQKGAREAEMVAQHAYVEKEHIVKLFLRQASHLFAYKQWIRMLQLEKLFLQLNIEDHQISSLLPAVPWTTPRGSSSSLLGSGDGAVKKRGGEKREARRYAVAFAVSLGLVSAGFLFGWKFGWWLPIF